MYQGVRRVLMWGMTTRPLLAAPLLAAALLSSACGATHPQATKAAVAADGRPISQVPNCVTVWLAGKTLPSGYKGCLVGTEEQLGASVDCSDGTQLVNYGSHAWVRTPGRIVVDAGDIADDPSFAASSKSCSP